MHRSDVTMRDVPPECDPTELRLRAAYCSSKEGLSCTPMRLLHCADMPSIFAMRARCVGDGGDAALRPEEMIDA